MDARVRLAIVSVEQKSSSRRVDIFPSSSTEQNSTHIGYLLSVSRTVTPFNERCGRCTILRGPLCNY